MLGRELHLPLDRLHPTAVQNTLTPVKASVTRCQKRMKQWFDKKKKFRIPDIAVADWVRARQPHRENKMASFWSTPQQVVRRLGPATYLLDGTRWHASCLQKVPAPPAMLTQNSGDIMPPRAEQEDSIPQAAAQPEDTPSLSHPVPPSSLSLPLSPASLPLFASPSAVCSPRPVHARARPDYLKDFVSTFHS